MLETLHIVLAMKPLEVNFVQNAIKYGVAGLNIDATRIEGLSGDGHWTNKREVGTHGIFGTFKAVEVDNGNEGHAQGRFPSNVILENMEEIVKAFPSEAGALGRASGPTRGKLGTQGRFGSANGNMGESKFYADKGSAARFFKQIVTDGP